MGTELIRAFTFGVLLVLYTYDAGGQVFYSIIDVDKIRINEFKHDGGIEGAYKVFGEPLKFIEYDQSDGLGPEGRDYMIYIDYDGLQLTYYRTNNIYYLDGISVTGPQYLIRLGVIAIRVGETLDVLKENFQESYNHYFKQYSKNSNSDLHHFYINMKIDRGTYIAYGLINIMLKHGVITQISFRFDEGT